LDRAYPVQMVDMQIQLVVWKKATIFFQQALNNSS